MQAPEDTAVLDPSADATPAVPASRRNLALLYTDLADSTRLAHALEPEVFRELLLQLRRIWQQVSARHQGRLVLAQGDGALIAFGLDGAGEDDGRRATETALDIHAEVARLQPEGLAADQLPLQVHSGIHAGTLLVSPGSLELGLYDLSGQITSTVKRLSDLAGPGEILASDQALGPYAHGFERQRRRIAREELDDPGLHERVQRVLGRRPMSSRYEATSRRGLTPFIGRAAVLQALQQFSAGGADGPVRCLVVQGSPGLGKTRLLEQWLRATPVDGLTLLRGSCESYLGAEVLQPFRQMLRAAAVLEPALGDALAPGAADPAARLAALAATRRLLLVIDDWQWADDASRQVLQQLLHSAPAPAIVLACRPREDGGDWVAGARHLTLQPFAPEETAAAVRRLAPGADPFLATLIHDYAGGVPLFVEELCHSVTANRLPKAIDGHQAARGWLATLVETRVSRLPAEQARVVRAASVVGNVVPLALLAAACDGQLPAPSTLQALVDSDFLRTDPHEDALRFKHGITRDAVYESIGLAERRRLHRQLVDHLVRTGEAAGRPDHLEALAHHSHGASDWAAAATHAEQAGDKAMAAFALDRARAQYLVAMDALDRLPAAGPAEAARWCLLCNKLGMTGIFDALALDNDLSRFERAVALARQLDDPDLLARALYWLAYTCYGFGRFRASAAHARDGLALARRLPDPRLAVQIEATLGQILTATGDYDDALALMDRALTAKQRAARPGSGTAIGSAYTLACRGSVLADRGDFTAAQACFDESLALLGSSPHPVGNSVRNWIGIALMWQGRWDRAEQVLDDSQQIALNTRTLLLLVVSRSSGGYARWRARRDPAGLRQLHDATQWIEARNGRFYTSLFHSWLAEAHLAEGHDDAARRHALRALARVHAGERLGEAGACRALLGAALRRGRPAAARRWLRRADAAAARRGSQREQALNRLAGVALLHASGDGPAADAQLAAARHALAALGMAWHAGQAGALVAECLPAGGAAGFRPAPSAA